MFYISYFFLSNECNIYSPVCGAEIINKNLALEKRIDQVKKFYKVLTSTTKDVLKTVGIFHSRQIKPKRLLSLVVSILFYFNCYRLHL